MYFSRLFFTLFGLIFLTVSAAKNCTWSQRTLHVVSSCPMTTEEKLMAEKIKKCEGLAGLQDCSESSLFKYHCVLNEAGDTFLEVCAPEVEILLGYCATFNISNGRIETQFNRTCYTGDRNPCPLQYMSSESYKFPTCYGFHDNITTYEKVTERNIIDPCLEEKKNFKILGVVSSVVFALIFITLVFDIVRRRDRRLLFIRKCAVCLRCSGYGFCKNTEKETDEKGNMPLPERKDFTMELEDISTMGYIFETEISEYTLRKKKEALFSEGNVHPFPKLMASLCITNICSINHISHISNGKIWLSNRKHVVEIDHNGRILQNFDIDDALGSASHTIDRVGDLFFFKDDTIFRANSMGKITTFLKQTGKVLSIYYSRITDEIILGTYKMLGNKINSKLSRYTRRGSLIDEIQSYRGMYVFPMFISENINGDICTTDSGTLMVKGVNTLGELQFEYDGKPTQTEFYPTGICNDAFGHVLVCNRHYTNPSVHVLDLHGHFLTVILTAKNGISDPYGLYVHENGSLYVGQYDCNTLMVYRYLNEV